MPETQRIRVLHCNSAGDGWTADSPDLDGLHVTGASYDETRTLAEDDVRSGYGSAAAACLAVCV